MTEELIRAHYNTARSLAHQMKLATDAHDFDDLVQEGAIAAWNATKDTSRDNPVTYGLVAARRRMQGHLSGRTPMLGSEREGGRIHDQYRQKDKREVVERIEDKAWERSALIEVERRIDVERALEGLQSRDLDIVAGVRADLSWDCIAKRTGMSLEGCRNRWRRILKPDLRERLATAA